jgi:iron complex transport system ATP-binding protein
VADPKVIMLDEPESNLDLKNQLVVLKMIENLVKTENICCIINTHFPQHALMYSDKTIMLYGGGEYYYGRSQETINAANIRRVFGVDSQIINIEHNDMSFKTLVPLDIAVSF